MARALEYAREAAARGEVPVGAVLVHEGAAVAAAGNLRESPPDPLGHAEIRVLRAAAQTLGRWRLTGCTLYVSLEPCPMCAAAACWARVDEIVFGAPDEKRGGLVSRYRMGSDGVLNHAPKVTGGVLADESAELLRAFFLARR